MMQRIVLAIGLVVLVLGTGAMLASGVSGSQVIEQIERSYALADGQEITVRGQNGLIRYDYWDGDEVVVRASKVSYAGVLSGWISKRVTVEFSQDSRGVQVVQTGPIGWLFAGNVGVHFDVKVPRNWEGKVVLHTSNGEITARGLRGEAQLRTSNGTISVEEQSGKLDAVTSNGRIELKSVSGVVQAETSNGPIRVNGAHLTQSGRLRTSNGPIELRAKLDAGANYEVRTSNGRVTVVLVEPDVDVELRTSNGDIDLNNTDVAVRELSRNRIAGRIGQGSAQLVVRTSNGNVSLSAVEAAR